MVLGATAASVVRMVAWAVNRRVRNWAANRVAAAAAPSPRYVGWSGGCACEPPQGRDAGRPVCTRALLVRVSFRYFSGRSRANPPTYRPRTHLFFATSALQPPPPLSYRPHPPLASIKLLSYSKISNDYARHSPAIPLPVLRPSSPWFAFAPSLAARKKLRPESRLSVFVDFAVTVSLPLAVSRPLLLLGPFSYFLSLSFFVFVLHVFSKLASESRVHFEILFFAVLTRYRGTRTLN